jgi:GDP-mannose 6-dehydrogenase
VIQNRYDTIGILGFTFKAGTDDLRESPMLALAERLMGKGYRLLLYDENISLPRLMSTNKSCIELENPHLLEFLTDNIDQVIRDSKVVIVSRQCDQYLPILRRAAVQHTPILYLEDALSGPNRANRHHGEHQKFSTDARSNYAW